MEDMERYLRSTSAIDCDHTLIVEKAESLTVNKRDTIDKAISLFYFVRDEIKYNMYVELHDSEHYRASRTLERKEGFCIQKSVLLVALARAVGIPARLHHADIRNHLASEKAKQAMGTNIFTYHGYVELFLDEEIDFDGDHKLIQLKPWEYRIYIKG